MIREERTTPGTLEVRDAGAHPILAGYAIVFNTPSVDLGGFREQIAPGAVTKTLKESDVLAYAYHESAAMLGRTSSGTLRLTTDDHGLGFEIDLPATTVGSDLAELARRGDVRGSSFGFWTIRDKWEESEDGAAMRTVLELSLHHVAPTPDPAYPDTEAALRSLATLARTDLHQVRVAARDRRLPDLLAGSEGLDDSTQDGEGRRESTSPVVVASFEL